MTRAAWRQSAEFSPTRTRRKRWEATRRLSPPLDQYEDHCLVELFWAKVEQYRPVATRSEKVAQNFLSFVRVASGMVLPNKQRKLSTRLGSLGRVD